MGNLPVRRKQFWTGEFATWLAANGAEIGVPTNPYEVIRYKAYHGDSPRAVTHIVYAKENGLLNFQGGSREHYLAFLAGERARFGEPSKKRAEEPRITKSVRIRAKLITRDGDECWFCGKPMGDDCTIEHLVPRSKGGGNRLDNYALAHSACNALAADKPLVAKIELRAKLRKEPTHVS